MDHAVTHGASYALVDVLSILLGLSAILALICSTSPAQAHSANEHDFSTNEDRSPAPRVNAAFGFNKQADPVSLVETLRWAVRLLPGVPEYRLKLADALLRLGDHDAAIEEIRSAVAIQNDDGHAQLQLGLLLMAKRDWRAASVALKEAVHLEPNQAHAHYSLGTAYSALGDISAAIRSFRRSLELRPTFFDAHYRLALLLKTSRQRHEAKDHLEAAAIGGVPHAQVLLGTAYRTGQGTEANLGLAIYWWMEAATHGQQTASDSLSRLRRHAVAPRTSSHNQAELRKGFESYRAILWNDFPEMSQRRDQPSLGKVLLEQHRVVDAIPTLLKECLALGEEAHAELSTLYETGWEPDLRPFDKRLLTCFETTAADGFTPAKHVLARIRARNQGVTTDMANTEATLKNISEQDALPITHERRPSPVSTNRTKVLGYRQLTR
ncbi:MAG: tetratricopeptide repeat protein [Nitrospira sp.]|nr:tetratricopeptide repeat protein [Nitrospira sp.]